MCIRLIRRFIRNFKKARPLCSSPASTLPAILYITTTIREYSSNSFDSYGFFFCLFFLSQDAWSFLAVLSFVSPLFPFSPLPWPPFFYWLIFLLRFSHLQNKKKKNCLLNVAFGRPCVSPNKTKQSSCFALYLLHARVIFRSTSQLPICYSLRPISHWKPTWRRPFCV